MRDGLQRIENGGFQSGLEKRSGTWAMEIDSSVLACFCLELHAYEL